MMSWHTCMWHSFDSSFHSLGTLLHRLSACSNKWWKPSKYCFFMSSLLEIIQTVNKRSPHSTYLTYMRLSTVLLVESLPILESPFFELLASLRNTCEWHSFSPCTCRSISSDWDEVLSNQPRNFWFILCLVYIFLLSVLLAERPEKEMWTKSCGKYAKVTEGQNYSYIVPKYNVR